MSLPDPRAEITRLHAESFGWALACCRFDPEEAEEVLQSAYLKVLDGRARFGGKSSFKTWLFSVIRWTASEKRRGRAGRIEAMQRWGGSGAAPEQAPGADPAERVQRSRESAELVAALARLPERQRQVLHLVFYQDLTLREASEVLGVSIGSVRQHYARGKERLRERLVVEQKEGPRDRIG